MNRQSFQTILIAILSAAPLLAQTITQLPAPPPPTNFATRGCPGAPAGTYSLIWTGLTSYDLCLLIGPTLKITTVNGRSQIDAVLPPPNTIPATGASMGTQLGDFSTRITSPAVLTLGGNCSAITPCNTRFGEAVAQFTQPALITLLPSSTGVARIYIDGSISPPVIGVAVSTGSILGAGTMNVTCTGMTCNVAPGVAFPPDSIPLAMCTATSGIWDLTGCVDFRSMYNSFRFVAGPGIKVTELFGTVTIAIDPNTGVIP